MVRPRIRLTPCAHFRSLAIQHDKPLLCRRRPDASDRPVAQPFCVRDRRPRPRALSRSSRPSRTSSVRLAKAWTSRGSPSCRCPIASPEDVDPTRRPGRVRRRDAAGDLGRRPPLRAGRGTSRRGGDLTWPAAVAADLQLAVDLMAIAIQRAEQLRELASLRAGSRSAGAREPTRSATPTTSKTSSAIRPRCASPSAACWKWRRPMPRW